MEEIFYNFYHYFLDLTYWRNIIIEFELVLTKKESSSLEKMKCVIRKMTETTLEPRKVSNLKYMKDPKPVLRHIFSFFKDCKEVYQCLLDLSDVSRRMERVGVEGSHRIHQKFINFAQQHPWYSYAINDMKL